MSFIIGTRGSLLALTQSGQVKALLEKATGESFELKIYQTRGDQQVDKPLWQMEGKDFFTKELDEALLKNQVDLVVHSYKDLGSERPAGIQLGAITERTYPHDILLIKKDVVEQLGQRRELVVGTSSPRRIYNIEKRLAEFLPARPIKITTKTLRGNVNTRIQKMRDGQYDAIVLALAGLERLALSESSLGQLIPLLEGITFSVLPLGAFPSAAAQGALGLEYHTGSPRAREIESLLKKVHHQKTALEVAAERELFQVYGGGCHLAVGIHVREQSDFQLTIEMGKVDKQEIHNVSLNSPKPLRGDAPLFVGLPRHKITRPEDGVLYDEYMVKTSLPLEKKLLDDNLFVTSGNCLEALECVRGAGSLWAGGSRTWKKLAERGLWVHGSADSLGERHVAWLAQSRALKIMQPKLENWRVLTNDVSSSTLGETLASYTRKFQEPPEDYGERLRKCQYFFWTSFFQYQKFCERYPFIKDKKHLCGMGKTLRSFQKHNIHVTPFSGMHELKRWAALPVEEKI